MFKRIFISSCISLGISLLLLGVFFIVTLHYPQTSSLKSVILPDYADHIAVEWDVTLYRFYCLCLIFVQVLMIAVIRSRAGKGCMLPVDENRPGTVLKSKPSFFWIIDLAVVALIAGALWMSDFQGAVTENYTSDRLHHMDTFIIAPGLAALSGARLYVDTFSQYGNGMPLLLGRAAEILGGFTYEHVLMVIVGLGILYVVCVYFFLKDWLNSSIAAVLGVLLVLNWNMFWPVTGDYFVWKHPSATVVRYFFDIIFFWCILRHARSGQWGWMMAAILINMAAFYYVNDSGVYVWVALASYWAAYLFHQGLWKKVFYWGLLAIPLLIVVPAYMNKSFWMNVTEYIQLAQGYFEGIKIQDVIKPANTAPLVLGAVMVGVYSLTLLVTGSLCFFRCLSREKLVLVPICCYGLCIFQYFIFRSSPDNIYVVSVPFALVISALGQWVFKALFPARHVWGTTAISIVVLWFLIDSQAWQRYPNVYNRLGDVFARQKANYQEHLDIDEDAALIGQWTAPKEPVALVSSFESLLLMKAKRRPYFYYFPLVTPGEFYMLDFYGMKMYTKSMLARTMDQLAVHPPARLFIEKKYVSGQLPAVYFAKFPSFFILVSYIKAHYAPVAEGKYLAVLKYQG